MIAKTVAGRPLTRSQRARAKALEVASTLFYRNGVRAVGMEQIVDRSGIAKTTIYRHFPTKDALIEAFLVKEDLEFWSQWDSVVADCSSPERKLEALCAWIAERVGRQGYRGCPQLNVAAEFADSDHPARSVAEKHKAEMFARIRSLCVGLKVTQPDMRAMQIALLYDGAFTSGGRLNAFDARKLLWSAVTRIVRD